MDEKVKYYICNKKTFKFLKNSAVVRELSLEEQAIELLSGRNVHYMMISDNNKEIPIFISEIVEDNNIMTVMKG